MNLYEIALAWSHGTVGLWNGPPGRQMDRRMTKQSDCIIQLKKQRMAESTPSVL